MPRLPTYVADAFTERPFVGNPAAVVVLARWLLDATRLAMAAEHTLSETAPDGSRVVATAHGPSRGPARTIAIAPGAGGVEIVSRSFAAKVGIPEDPVTGAAHTKLVPFRTRSLLGRAARADASCLPPGLEARRRARVRSRRRPSARRRHGAAPRAGRDPASRLSRLRAPSVPV